MLFQKMHYEEAKLPDDNPYDDEPKKSKAPVSDASYVPDPDEVVEDGAPPAGPSEPKRSNRLRMKKEAKKEAEESAKGVKDKGKSKARAADAGP